MTAKISDLRQIAREAIAANWRVGNARVFSCGQRHERVKLQRRKVLREWVAVLRLANDPANAPYLTARLREAGPLMAHDLRNRAILAGLDRRLSDDSQLPRSMGLSRPATHKVCA